MGTREQCTKYVRLLWRGLHVAFAAQNGFDGEGEVPPILSEPSPYGISHLSGGVEESKSLFSLAHVIKAPVHPSSNIAGHFPSQQREQQIPTPLASTESPIMFR